jgi:hypothetical protein
VTLFHGGTSVQLLLFYGSICAGIAMAVHGHRKRRKAKALTERAHGRRMTRREYKNAVATVRTAEDMYVREVA